MYITHLRYFISFCDNASIVFKMVEIDIYSSVAEYSVCYSKRSSRNTDDSLPVCMTVDQFHRTVYVKQ